MSSLGLKILVSAVQSRPCPPAFSSSWATVLFLSDRECAQIISWNGSLTWDAKLLYTAQPIGGVADARYTSEYASAFIPQQLTSYGGLELFRRYVRRLGLRPRLRRACAQVGGANADRLEVPCGGG